MSHPRRRIDRYLAFGLPPKAEAKLRAHLSGCEPCRRYYDDGVLTMRVLAGEPDRLTHAETERMVRRAMEGASCTPPQATAPSGEVGRPSRWDALFFVPPRLALAAASVLLVVGLGGLWMARAPTVARVGAANALTLDGRPAHRGDPVAARTRVEVGPDGLAELRLERGGALRLFPDTALDIGPGARRVQLERGAVWARVQRGGGPFRVTTDRATAEVLGTSFVVERRKSGNTDVRVMTGTVRVTDRDGRGSVDVRGGEKTSVADSGPPAPPQPYDPDEDRGIWKRLWSKIWGAIRKAVESVFGN